jgi:hypothetical protein
MKQNYRKDIIRKLRRSLTQRTQSVAYLKKKEQIPTVVVYHHPHHIEKQQFIKARVCASTHLCTNREPERKLIKRCMEDYYTTGRDQARETIPWKPDMMQSKIRVERQQMDIMFDFHWDGWMVVLGTSWLHCLASHIVWFLLVFRG